jgi:hypothetical protein
MKKQTQYKPKTKPIGAKQNEPRSEAQTPQGQSNPILSAIALAKPDSKGRVLCGRYSITI